MPNKVKKGKEFTYQIGTLINTKFSWICAECGLIWFSKEQARKCSDRGHISSYIECGYKQKARGRISLKKVDDKKTNDPNKALGSKAKCKGCDKYFLRKEMISVKKKPNERVGVESIFETGYFHYCKNCYKNLKIKKE